MQPSRLAALFAGAVIVFGQASRPAYELASIKPNNSGDRNSGFDDYPGRIIFTNMSLQHLIELAYGVMPFQVSGPAWLTSEHFDIVAKYPDGAAAPSGNSPPTSYETAMGWTHPGRNLMLRTLLEDRFRLSVHRETKPGSGYALVAAKSGFKLRRSEPGNPATQQSGNRRIQKLSAKKTSLAMLASLLTLYTGHTVVDSTGIDGVFDFELQWSTDDAVAEAKGPDLQPSIFTALEESLGLRLQPEKVPVELIVVDHIDHRPAEN